MDSADTKSRVIPSSPARSGGDERQATGTVRSAAAAPSTRHLRPGLMAQALDHLLLPSVAAWFAFPQRFDRAVAQLAQRGGRAVSPRQAAAHFGGSLFLQIDPRILTHRLDEKYVDADGWHWIGESFLDAGDWQERLSPLRRSPAHREIVEICRTRDNFRDGKRYRTYLRQIAEGQPPRRNGRPIDTVDKLDAYFRYYADLIDNIDRTGILPRNRFQRAASSGQQPRRARSFWLDFVERDIGVAIDKDGRLVRHTSGKHRLAAAIGLGLNEVPVEIRMVHLGWLQAEMQTRQLPAAKALAAALREKGSA